MHTLFLASNFAVFSLIDSLIFHRMLSASCPPPSLLRSRNDFSTSVVVRIASFSIVLSDSSSLMLALPSLLALGHLLDLLLSCSEFLFISSNFLAFGVWSILSWYCLFARDASCACPFHASCFPSSRCVLDSSCALYSLHFETVSAFLLPPSTLWLLVVAVKSSPFEPGS